MWISVYTPQVCTSGPVPLPCLCVYFVQWSMCIPCCRNVSTGVTLSTNKPIF
ncbi:MAG: hypothetical protein BYD32DRAFT_417555 [Podila humilis]|nr:MAG: hypothetical protein BYD32DRAFT_417555 [Podila humilis]